MEVAAKPEQADWGGGVGSEKEVGSESDGRDMERLSCPFALRPRSLCCEATRMSPEFVRHEEVLSSAGLGFSISPGSLRTKGLPLPAPLQPPAGDPAGKAWGLLWLKAKEKT